MKPLTPKQRQRWQEFVDALEASQVHLRPDRQEAIEILVKQFQGDGPIYPVALPQPEMSDEEVAANVEAYLNKQD